MESVKEGCYNFWHAIFMVFYVILFANCQVHLQVLLHYFRLLLQCSRLYLVPLQRTLQRLL